MAQPCYERYPTTYRKLESPSGQYVIQQIHTWSGSSVFWWREAHSGYTCRLDQAGIYSESQARVIEALRGEDYAVPIEVARAAASQHVLGDDLQQAIKGKRDTLEVSTLSHGRGSHPTAVGQGVAAEPTCGWYDEDDDGEMVGEVCGAPATHYSCNIFGPIHPSKRNACVKHKCRCGC